MSSNISPELRNRGIALTGATLISGALLLGSLAMPVAAESTQPYPRCTATRVDECRQAQSHPVKHMRRHVPAATVTDKAKEPAQ
ncbi:hypothetical protein [Novosphingobium sp. 18050]|uniref:hypothetical protein n=1 Tax=Novosphingobium sp. 18050 TaxID=2681398 RepID=UPI001359C301|nr:hypothetical protein [Novosphingobium sp. 18050]